MTRSGPCCVYSSDEVATNEKELSLLHVKARKALVPWFKYCFNVNSWATWISAQSKYTKVPEVGKMLLELTAYKSLVFAKVFHRVNQMIHPWFACITQQLWITIPCVRFFFRGLQCAWWPWHLSTKWGTVKNDGTLAFSHGKVNTYRTPWSQKFIQSYHWMVIALVS